MIQNLHFCFGTYKTSVYITQKVPDIEEIAGNYGDESFQPLLICDDNTEQLAMAIRTNANIPVCTIKSGESNKNWLAVEAILRSAHDAGIGRDGIFIGVGGGLVGDLSAFAASIYMRGCRLVLVSTSLLGMVDASLGGKTGCDLFGIKNLAGTFYPASHVYMPMESLASLPLTEWKSGMAEIIKTAVLDSDDFLDEIYTMAASTITDPLSPVLFRCISRAVQFKAGIVAQDPLETGIRRILNLGHTFGHALEAAAGLGIISHGEAVAWGIARACDLALVLGECPQERTEKINKLLAAYGFETAAPHPLMSSIGTFMEKLNSDKKKRGGNLTFIIPDGKSAVCVDSISPDIISNIINGEL